MIDAIAKRAKDKMQTRPTHPKDKEHAISAQQVSNEMMLWEVERIGKPLDMGDEP